MDMADFRTAGAGSREGRTRIEAPGSQSPRRVTELDRCVGARLRATRLHCGLSQSSVAEQLGVSFQQVQKYENGANRMSVSTFVAVAETLGLSPMLLLERCLQDRDAAAPGAQPAPRLSRSDTGRAEQTMRLLEGFGRLRDAKAQQQVLDFLALLAKDMGAAQD